MKPSRICLSMNCLHIYSLSLSAFLEYLIGRFCSTSAVFFLCGRVPWLYQHWPGGFMVFVVLCPGTPEGSTGSGSGFKASQMMGQRLSLI